tara:strand:- start:1426 stop:1884 length:459 start_codon:yes stop_codon:yes gene_type:complete
MKNILILLLLTLVSSNCGFNPIYGSKDNSFEILEVDNLSSNRSSIFIEKTIKSISNKNSIKKFKVQFNYDEKIVVVLKDKKGNPSKNKININVDLSVRDENEKLVINKVFTREFGYDVQSNKFKMKQYEKNIKENLINEVSRDIVFLLTTIK